jgi:CBS domain-containing protein
MSPRAACRLEGLGFEHVYDYMPGKVDWLARGLPRDGEKAGERRAGDLARDDVVTCELDERIAHVRARVEASPYRFALVISAGGTLLGRLRRSALEAAPQATAAELMEPGPSTIRWDVAIDEVRRRLNRRNLRTAVITTPDGALVGVVRRDDLASD